MAITPVRYGNVSEAIFLAIAAAGDAESLTLALNLDAGGTFFWMVLRVRTCC